MLRQKPGQFLLVALSLCLYIAVAYGIARHQTFPLFVCYFTLFGFYLLAIRRMDSLDNGQVKFWLLASAIFRIAILFSVPALSDDFYRFIWDGRLLAAGFHPFADVPSFYMNPNSAIPGIDAELYGKLNSKETFTIYPPFGQFIFWLSVVLSNGTIYGSMLVMKVILILFELGTLLIFPRILREFKQPQAHVLIYALNPLVILELTGNLHFEGVMIFFLLMAILFLRRQSQFVSSLAFALSVCTKLIPLLFLPMMVRHLGWKKALMYGLLACALTALMFLPFLNEAFISGLATSLRYYFQRFEFNASIYYLVREAGYLLFGFNVIQFSGPVLGLAATAIILLIAFRPLPREFASVVDAGIFRNMLWCLLVYFLFTTILHPWYIITLLAICIFTPFRFPVLWTAMIFLTYEGYTESGFRENLLLIGFEYIVITAYLLYEKYGRNDKITPDHIL